jgi:hypothetical protein
VASGKRPCLAIYSTNDTLGSESLQQGSGVHAEESSDGNAAIGDEDFLSGAGAIDPFTQVSPQVGHGNIHVHSVHLYIIDLYVSGIGHRRRLLSLLYAMPSTFMSVVTHRPMRAER